MLTRTKLQAVAVALTGMAALAPLQPAAAQDRPVFVYGESQDTRVEHVRFADLDLTTSTGARKLNARVGKAVERVCVYEPEDRLPTGYFVCSADSWDRARPQIDRAISKAQALALRGEPATIGATITVAAR